MIETAIMGYGTIGSGMTGILGKNRDVIASQARQKVELKYVLDLREFPDNPVAGKIVHDFKVIEQDEEVKIVVETTDGLNSAYPFVKACLMADKNVITSDKALVAAHGTGLPTIAEKKHVNFFFEASVDDGTPIIRPLYRCLMGKRIEKITGILDGTTSFILTKMDREGESFENALKEVQNLGYTGCNPEADVEGRDTCHKIAILAATATGKEMNYEDVYTGGITQITDIGSKYAEKMGTSVKLFGTSRIENSRILAYMAPVMINKTSPLYSVNDVFNGILVRGDMLGTSMFYGSDARELLTRNAMVVDIIEAAQNFKKNVPMGWTDKKQTIESMDQTQFRYLVGVAGSYRNKGQDVKNVFGQAEVIKFYGVDEFAFLTTQMAESEFRKVAVSYDSRGQERSECDVK